MTIKIFEKYTPRANGPDGNYPYGSLKNESLPDANDGTPLDKDWGNDMVGFTDALLDEAGIIPSGDPDTVLVSQRLEALKHVATTVSEHTNLLTNFNFSVETPDDSQTKPNATPETYVADHQVFFGWFADDATGVTDLTYNNGVINFTAGSIYQEITFDGGLEAIGSTIIASIAGADLIGTASNVTLTNTGTAWKVTIESGSSNVLSAKLEDGDVISGHTALSAEGAVNANHAALIRARTLQDETSNRSLGVPYSNDTDTDIIVYFRASVAGVDALVAPIITIDGFAILSTAISTGDSVSTTISATVGVGESYTLTLPFGTLTSVLEYKV